MKTRVLVPHKLMLLFILIILSFMAITIFPLMIQNGIDFEKDIRFEIIYLGVMIVSSFIMSLMFLIRGIHFKEEYLVIRRFRNNNKLQTAQKRHKIKYNDIQSIELDYLDFTLNSLFKPINRVRKYFTVKRYKTKTPCFVFHLHDSTKKALLIKDFTKDQVGEVIEQLTLRGFTVKNIQLLQELALNSFNKIKDEQI